MNINDLTELVKKSPGYNTWVNDRGNTVHSAHDILHYSGDGSRYTYDDKLRGWKQYDTENDAWYFGVWVSIEDRATFTYAEGDITLVICPDDDHMRAELEDAEKFYGAPPPMAVAIDDNGQVTEYYDERPTL